MVELLVKIRPFRYGNDDIIDWDVKELKRLKSDRFGMEILRSFKNLTINGIIAKLKSDRFGMEIEEKLNEIHTELYNC